MPELEQFKTPIAFVVTLTILGCIGGAAVGYLMGTYNPAYYRAMFPDVQPQRLDELAVGIGLGVTQGSFGGFVAGIVLAVASLIANARA
ncbi:hypothetical protein [Allorhodopirellula solitaria]|uniref:Uncharacterized protein n=1 Tax=Allorhodopirellula solitaria TaxID=2527987 RepID=A0A5C5YF77_9BACT|nr:hypothetical protein [Allorhodopirellula solitaria]TWT72995.1 hypothetical protein CA85_14560 [Allorhodopirellula solitaria]